MRPGEQVKEQTSFIHKSSYVDESSDIGEGTKIWHFCNIMRGAKIGKNCVLGQNVHVGPKVMIGDRCKIQNNVSLYEGVILEDDVFCGPSMVFTNVINPRSFIERKSEFMQTLVRKGASIGANATIVCGVTIGQYALIGAGAVLTNDAPDYALIVGTPGRIVGWVCRCGVRLPLSADAEKDGEASCSVCDLHYEKTALEVKAI